MDKSFKRVSMPIFFFYSVSYYPYTYANRHHYNIINASANGEKPKEG